MSGPLFWPVLTWSKIPVSVLVTWECESMCDPCLGGCILGLGWGGGCEAHAYSAFVTCSKNPGSVLMLAEGWEGCPSMCTMSAPLFKTYSRVTRCWYTCQPWGGVGSKWDGQPLHLFWHGLVAFWTSLSLGKGGGQPQEHEEHARILWTHLWGAQKSGQTCPKNQRRLGRVPDMGSQGAKESQEFFACPKPAFQTCSRYSLHIIISLRLTTRYKSSYKPSYLLI